MNKTTRFDGNLHASAHNVEQSPRRINASSSSSETHLSAKPRKHADIELDDGDVLEGKPKPGLDRENATNSDDNENRRLLGNDADALSTVPLATEMARRVAGEQSGAASLETNPQPISWSSLPKKGQLAILTLARLSEPLTQTSLQSYMFYQLKSFTLADGSDPSDSTVARQAGVLAAAFTGAQFMTAMIWGRLADSERMGRKRVILIGLLGTAVGSLGFGFSKSFHAAVFWRCVGGILNGNIGVMRTMISEMVEDKKFLSRAFLLLPMTFNIGVIIGPLLGGLLADPVGSYPGIFGPGGTVGGTDGVWWLTKWPYALPNVVNAGFLLLSATALIFGLEETLESLRDKPDYGIKFRKWVVRMVTRRPQHDYTPLIERDENAGDIEMRAAMQEAKQRMRRKLPFKRIWTPNVLFTLLSHGLLAMHVGTFNSLWFVFLSTPRYSPDPTATHNSTSIEHKLHVPPNYHPRFPFTFTGGLALPPPSIGTALAILGVIGISLQLILFPPLSFRFGTVASYRYALLLFPIAYFATPFIATIPSKLPPPAQASGFLVWLGITLVLIIQVMARTFALPSAAILINNSSPHPSVLGTIHGIAQSVSSATRTVGPVLAGWLYGVGLGHGVVGTAWWAMAGLAVVGAVAGRWVKEGDGREIWLEGEMEEEEETKR
ncbi:Hypothetical protein R9X50_00550700 [Acrodontium crateriforme]|uniref:Major facilitator superfamily (MFS) profile domain-containing protein n=1 Tax=Acrodontium crateriforme TaxID=150365 RepID=A0AAQ3MCN2_9PEZI|nr:Hypothetical protein R9X50_00550700 [Acrodontium crateriforme]